MTTRITTQSKSGLVTHVPLAWRFLRVAAHPPLNLHAVRWETGIYRPSSFRIAFSASFSTPSPL